MRFVFLDQITTLRPSEMAQAIKTVSYAQDIFGGHSISPEYPSTLLIESMAQLAGVLVEETLLVDGYSGLLALLVMVNKAQFQKIVVPGDLLAIEAKVVSADSLKASVTASVVVDGELVAQAQLAFVMGADHTSQLWEHRRAQVKLWLQGSTR